MLNNHVDVGEQAMEEAVEKLAGLSLLVTHTCNLVSWFRERNRRARLDTWG